jgi:hypothetical protein
MDDLDKCQLENTLALVAALAAAAAAAATAAQAEAMEAAAAMAAATAATALAAAAAAAAAEEARRREGGSPCTTCLYTINTGGYEKNVLGRGDLFGDDCDMLYYSDDTEILAQASQQGWIPMYLTHKPGTSSESKLLQRTAKTQPHLFLPPQYIISIYMDANIEPTFTSIAELWNMFAVEEYDIICWKHPCRTTVKDEAKEVEQFKLETQEHIAHIMQMQTRDAFQDDVGLCETNIIIRKHRQLVHFSNEWKHCISICRRDQISFDWLVWKHGVTVIKHPYETKPIKWIEHTGNISNRSIPESTYPSYDTETLAECPPGNIALLPEPLAPRAVAELEERNLMRTEE